ncbi:MAG: nuclear transport factor 2 family protein [bacterium]|nr:nuclear transport factor 2 family protein [bacterium]
MLKNISLAVIGIVILITLAVSPSFAQRNLGSIDENPANQERRDNAAIRDLLNLYEQSFNARDIDWRMSLCLGTYQEYGFENGQFLQVRDYNQTKREVGGYWASITSLEYSMDEVDITLDSPLAFVRAYTTHIAPNDDHSSIVYFSLVKIDGAWRIAWDSYNIVRRYSDTGN